MFFCFFLFVVVQDLGLNFKNWISNKLKAQNISVTKPHGRSMRQDMALPWFEFYLEMLDRTAVWEKAIMNSPPKYYDTNNNIKRSVELLVVLSQLIIFIFFTFSPSYV